MVGRVRITRKVRQLAALFATVIIALIIMCFTYSSLLFDIYLRSEDKIGGNTVKPLESTVEFEVTRRRISTEVEDMWYFIKGELRKINSSNKRHVVDRTRRILEESEQRKNSIQRHLRKLSSMDGLEEWRKKEAKDLEGIVQNRLRNLQARDVISIRTNPKDCTTAKKILCKRKSFKNNGYSYEIGLILACLVMAYASNRTLLIEGWNFGGNSWEDLFMPLSDTCANLSGQPLQETVILMNARNMKMMDSLPMAIPSDLSNRLTKLHGYPGLWWLSQLYKYLLRPQESLIKLFNDKASKMNFTQPVVGVQVRRTDKLRSEASYHSLDEYMEHVEEYFKFLEIENPGVKRLVYLATDDPNVLQEAKNFPNYEFIRDEQTVSLAKNMATRYWDLSLKGFLADVHFLSRSDYLVCTFSSGVCRLAYVLMQTYRPDASKDYHSLDDIFYFYVTSEHLQRALLPHSPRDPSEMELIVGDLIHVSGNWWNGSSVGINSRTKIKGQYPSFKVEDVINIAPMPLYTDNP